MQIRHLFDLSSAGSHGRLSGIFRKWIVAVRLPGFVLAMSAALTCSSPAHGHGGHSGGEMNQQSSHGHDYGHQYYRDPFWGSWYPGYSGAYDSNYWYTPTPEQQAAAKKQVQAYLAAVNKGRKHPA